MNSLRLIFNITKALITSMIFIPVRYYGVGVVDERGYLSYVYKGKTYLVPVITSQGPVKFFNVSEGDEDVTSIIEPYAGPKRDFYGRTPTPSDFGYEELTFFIPRGYLTFSATEPIVLTPPDETFE